MSQNKQDQLLSHDSDGIQEYDNDLPKWWVWLFIVTVIWSGVYVVYFHFSGRPLPRQELEAQRMAQTQTPPPSEAPESALNWGVLAQEADRKALGKTVYAAKCAACHGPEGQGLVGPNLTDQHWIHGGSPEKIYATILKGVPEKGMLAWKALLKKEELIGVTVYLLSLKGTKPAQPKAPQGTLEP